MTYRRLTDEVFALIPELIRIGKNKEEIAAMYNVKPSTLVVQCSRRKISLRKGSKPRLQPLTIAVPTPLSLSDNALVGLRMAAKARGKDEIRLASELLEVIAKDNLYEAVLDNHEEPVPA